MVATATPRAPPSRRPTLNIVEARPEERGGIVAKAAAWVATNTWPTPRPMSTRSPRIHQRLCAPAATPSSPMKVLEASAPTIRCLRGPSLRYRTLLASWDPVITPMASGAVLSPEPSALSPRPSW